MKGIHVTFGYRLKDCILESNIDVLLLASKNPTVELVMSTLAFAPGKIVETLDWSTITRENKFQ
jgi:hypothetical protein